jgi:hypothetical protein
VAIACQRWIGTDGRWVCGFGAAILTAEHTWLVDSDGWWAERRERQPLDKPRALKPVETAAHGWASSFGVGLLLGVLDKLPNLLEHLSALWLGEVL